MDAYYAHSPNKSGQWHKLIDHLGNTGDLASHFAERFGTSELAYIAGLWHDIGKFSTAFQKYLLAAVQAEEQGLKPPVRGSIDHSTAGAILSHNHNADFLSLIIAGHHSGLSSTTELRSRLQKKRSDQSVLESLNVYSECELLNGIPHDMAALLPDFVTKGHEVRVEFFVRMLFSALVDADSLDTESHTRPASSVMRQQEITLAQLWDEFTADQSRLITESDNTPLNKSRKEMYDACIRAAAEPQGVFSLTIPTGGGKTRASMGFALQHALQHGHERVIVAIPYTSIIDQTAKVYRDIFGSDAVLEHHSAVEVRDDDEETYASLASQNWDAPIVVTTTVQLFDSLFSNRRGRCRKLHNVAGSVLILDEVQTLPVHLLVPIISVLQELVDNYGVTVVLCTATQPALEGNSPYLNGFKEVCEIISEPHQYFAQLKRVDFDLPCRDTTWTWERAADEMRSTDQCLAIVNTRKNALDLLNALDDEDALHLSTLLCGIHRKKVLETVKERLAAGERCHLVSTQVVEAGVDIDFPVVLRALGPLDRIVQAAGRCNREGRMAELGRTVVFKPETGSAPRGAYSAGMAEAETILKTKKNLHDPKTFSEYFRLLYQDVNTDKRNIQHLRQRLDFPKVAEKFQMIDGITSPVVIHYPGHEEEVGALLQKMRAKGKMARGLWRRLQPYVINMYEHEINRYRSQGLCEMTEFGFDIWKGSYDQVRGVSDTARDPADLVC